MSLELDQCRHENPTGNVEEVTWLCQTKFTSFSFCLLLFLLQSQNKILNLSLDQKLMIVKWFAANQIS